MRKVKAVFKGAKKLGGGIYLVVYPAKNNFFEVLIDKQQHFSVIADTATLKKTKDNLLILRTIFFLTPTKHIWLRKGRAIDSAEEKSCSGHYSKRFCSLEGSIEKNRFN